ncbi:phthiodiolone/phenolphthiodiolone dimycocerosates ketoreductase [Haloechinothrix alba]|uniref:Phthiodiolone/phenolphthiodiolone dimycocerosates ketoreductase n=1 Tax=Haloechinothrix alba TaxID=664784 RepID=A0A239AC62_9PSEU|nr:LLM class flavin-dependent oxidoreductase [Haloechinothrix alba]SNR92473.1 phthiodiolone/phenolphthiodiolone dimycocerosates ketoreductase [Haloechinothrix alba]
MPENVHVNVPIVYSRHLPVSAAVDTARTIQASGVADSLTVWDQMTFFAPPGLWCPENSPLAAVMPDIDSFPDPYVILSQIAAAAPGFGLNTTSDAMRRAPAEFTQTLMTLADVSGGPTMVQMGTGELKQCKPFGHKRSQGPKRLEDTFRIFRKFMDTVEPIDHEGNVWTLENSWLGRARPAHRPQLWALGGGPRLIDVATRYGDGFCTAAPFVWTSPDQAAEQISAIKQRLEVAGRDPEQFGFGMWWICLMHEDETVIETTMANDYIRWISATMGRFDSTVWTQEGVEPPMGESWHYATDMLPLTYSAQETADVLSRATPEVVTRSWHHGSPDKMMKAIAPYLDAGVNFVQIVDFLPLVRPAEEAPEGLRRAFELAGAIKQHACTLA